MKALTRTNTWISHWNFSPVFSILRIRSEVLALQAVRSDYVVLEAGQASIYDIWTTSWTHNENPEAIFITQPTLFRKGKVRKNSYKVLNLCWLLYVSAAVATPTESKLI